MPVWLALNSYRSAQSLLKVLGLKYEVWTSFCSVLNMRLGWEIAPLWIEMTILLTTDRDCIKLLSVYFLKFWAYLWNATFSMATTNWLKGYRVTLSYGLQCFCLLTETASLTGVNSGRGKFIGSPRLVYNFQCIINIQCFLVENKNVSQ